MDAALGAKIYLATTWIIPALLAITLHEAAHGYAAWRLGDDTAKKMGRVTFNPLKHIDPFGTILLPALLIASPLPFVFGYAKPVPVAMHRLHRPRRDMIMVAAAGPGANIMIALVSAVLLRVAPLLPDASADWLTYNLFNSILLNLLLAIFNMLPLPPLDGGRVAVCLLPQPLAHWLARLDRYGLIILIAALFVLPVGLRFLGSNLDPFDLLIWGPIEWLLPYFLDLGGLATRSAA
jgi:Zn-dependent protease